MQSPSGDGSVGFYVNYDGDDVGDALREIIRRDGYAAVFATFSAVESKHWRELNPETADELPGYVARFPSEVARCRAVKGYGVLFVDEAALSDTGVFTPDHCDRAYEVSRDGTVRAQW